MADPILDLATLIERPTIDIDGTRYEILSPDELSVLDNRRFGLWAQQLDAMQQGDTVDPGMDALVDTMARKILVGVPDDVFSKLSGAQRVQVVEVFTLLLVRAKMRVAGAAQTMMGTGNDLASLLIGEMFSRGSSDSMGAARVTGWRTRLSQLFARIWP